MASSRDTYGESCVGEAPRWTGRRMTGRHRVTGSESALACTVDDEPLCGWWTVRPSDSLTALGGQSLAGPRRTMCGRLSQQTTSKEIHTLYRMPGADDAGEPSLALQQVRDECRRVRQRYG